MAIEKVIFESVGDRIFKYYVDYNEKNEIKFNT